MGLIAPAFAGAAETLSVTAIPPRLELEALPGATVQESLKVRNESTADQAFKVVIKDFIVTNNQGTPLPVDETVYSDPATSGNEYVLQSDGIYQYNWSTKGLEPGYWSVGVRRSSIAAIPTQFS